MTVDSKRSLLRCLGWLFVLAGVTIMIDGSVYGDPQTSSPSSPVGSADDLKERKTRAAWIIHGGAVLAVSSALIAFVVDSMLRPGRSTKKSVGSGSSVFLAAMIVVLTLVLAAGLYALGLAMPTR